VQGADERSESATEPERDSKQGAERPWFEFRYTPHHAHSRTERISRVQSSPSVERRSHCGGLLPGETVAPTRPGSTPPTRSPRRPRRRSSTGCCSCCRRGRPPPTPRHCRSRCRSWSCGCSWWVWRYRGWLDRQTAVDRLYAVDEVGERPSASLIRRGERLIEEASDW